MWNYPDWKERYFMGNEKKKKCIYHFKDLQQEIRNYGYEYSFKYHMTYIGMVVLAVLIISLLMQIHLVGLVCILAVVLLILPTLTLYRYKGLYEESRFLRAVDYMEYMIYGFLRVPKILNSLEEAEKLCSGHIKECIQKAVDRIRYANLYEDIYTDALKNLEDYYGNDRMRELHRFLVQVEQQGGEYRKSLEILLEDIRHWAEMVSALQKERKALEYKIAISICLSLATAITMVSLLPQNIGNIAENMVYQCSSVFFVISSLLLYLLAQKTLIRSWLSERENLLETEHAYEYCKKNVHNKNRHYRFQEKKVVKHIQKEFPVWLRNVVLQMNTENVFVAMKNAAEQSSFVLKSELKSALEEIEKLPGSMKGYQSFLKNFKIPEIKNVFLMFYSLSEFGTKEAEGQVNSLIMRNKKLAEQSERIINEDSLGIFGLYMLCPMILAAGKLLLDMWVFVQQFLYFYSNVIQ